MLRRTRVLEPDGWAADRTRPRVLVEDPDGAVRTAAGRILERAGFQVSTCAGPGSGGTCPEVTRDGCRAVDTADVVYASLDWHREEHRDVLRAQRRQHPDVPVVVEIARPDAERAEDLLEGCDVVHLPVDGAAMVAAVQRVLDRDS